MIDMDRYMTRVINKKDEAKAKKNIIRRAIIFYVFILITIISLILILFGVYCVFNKDNTWIYYYTIGTIVIVVNIITLMIFDSIDPVRNYSLNDKILIYLDILKNELTSYNPQITGFKKFYNDEKINFMIISINRQFYGLKESIENSFIYRDDKFKSYVENIDNIIILFRNAKENNYDKICNIIQEIINIYEICVINEFKDLDCKVNFSVIRNNKIKKLRDNVNDILNNKVTNSGNNKIKGIKSKEKIVNFSIAMVTVVTIFIFLFLKGLPTTQQITAIIAAVIAIDTFIIKFIIKIIK